jgi:hypothetical protein
MAYVPPPEKTLKRPSLLAIMAIDVVAWRCFDERTER